MRILYIASLNTKKDKFDGERIKSSLIHKGLIDANFTVSVINLSVFKYFQAFRLLFIVIFHKKRFDKIIISKDPRGAKIIHQILKLAKYPMDKVIYFEIGPFLYDLINKKRIKPDLFKNDLKIIVETESLKNDLTLIGFKNISVYPNFKKNPGLPFVRKKYPKDILNLIYFSRIEEEKGIYKLLDALLVINSEKVKFTLDIYGLFMSKSDEIKVLQYANKYSFINYGGKLDLIGNPNNYKKLCSYDLHVFPTLYGEGFPGSLIDFLFLGIPTVSSNFARCKDILTDDDSFIYKTESKDNLVGMLEHIYNQQNLISKKGKKSFQISEKYTYEKFIIFLRKMLYE